MVPGARSAVTGGVAVTGGLAVAGSYLVGSVPVAVLVGRRRGIDPRDHGDHNPGYWNARAVLGAADARRVLVGDTAKGVAAGVIGLLAGGPWWVGYLAVAAAMIGHAWPLFACFRGGRAILTFAGGVLVLVPVVALVCIGLCVLVSVATQRFAHGARVGVFAFPLVQLLASPRAHVAATGGLMSIIGLRFAMAARRSGRASSTPDAAPPA
jgi:glycerol-3-phosphate acyltransferase PlsY